jgi:hypothetical protein
MGILTPIIDLLPEGEAKKGTNVNRNPTQGSEGDVLDAGVIRVVEEKTHILQTE